MVRTTQEVIGRRGRNQVAQGLQGLLRTFALYFQYSEKPRAVPSQGRLKESDWLLGKSGLQEKLLDAKRPA